jgi:selenocysteine lyase/cysteine desulfurase
MAPNPPYDIQDIRKGISLLERFVPLNHCSQAPQMDLTRAAAQEYLDSWRGEGMAWDRWMAEVEAARAAFGRLINAFPEEVSVCTSVSQATSSLASALDFRGGRRKVAVTEGEFPTVGQVWLAQQQRGAECAWIPVRDGVIPLEGYRDVLDEETLLVSACHGYYQSGFKQDLAQVVSMAREVGALVYVDAYQTLGSCAVDVKALDLDFLASGNLKFLMGIPGIAFLYVKPSLAEGLEPRVTGWFGREDPFSFQVRDLSWASGARRFDTGTPPVLEAYVARAAMDFLLDLGLDGIEAWTRELSRALVEGGEARGLRLLGSADPGRKAPTTAFLVPGDAHAVEVRLRERGILASARGPAVRLAPHFYNTLDDVNLALDDLAEISLGHNPGSPP